MSTIVVVKTDKGAVIAADSSVHNRSYVRTLNNAVSVEKVFYINEDCAMGIVGPSKIRQAIPSMIERGLLDPSEFKKGDDLFLFLEKIARILESEYRFTPEKTDGDEFEDFNFEAIALVNNSIVGSDTYGAVTEYKRFWAKGSGVQFALGALEAIYDETECPRKLATRALEIAAFFDSRTREPFLILPKD